MSPVRCHRATRAVIEVLLLTIGGLGLAPVAAMAEPAPFESMTMTCDGLGTIEAVAPGNAGPTPSFISGTHGLILTYSVTYTAWVDGVPVVSDSWSREQQDQPGGLLSCTFDETFGLGGHRYRIAGSVTGRAVGQPPS